MDISPQLTQALENNGVTAEDFNMTIEQIQAAPDGSSWHATKGEQTFALVKNSPDSYTITSSQE